MSDIDDVLERDDPEILARHKNISAKDARNNFSEIMNATKFGKERFVITHRGKPTMALVTINDLRLLERFAEHADRFSDYGTGGTPLNTGQVSGNKTDGKRRTVRIR